MSVIQLLASAANKDAPTLSRFPAELFGYEPKPERIKSTCVYQITAELASAYSKEQLALQVARLKSTGRWHPPKGRYTIRTSLLGADVVKLNDDRRLPNGYVELTPEDREPFNDYHMDGENFLFTSHLERCRIRVANKLKATIVRSMEASHNEPFSFYDYRTRKVWWERGDWFCHQVEYEEHVLGAEHGQAALELLVVILHDRNTIKVAAPPRERSDNLKRSGLDNQRPADLQVVTLYCPGRVSNADGSTSHASPKLHYRAEHLRRQPYGPRSNPQHREIIIAAQWINAADVDPLELNTPNRIVRLTGGA